MKVTLASTSKFKNQILDTVHLNHTNMDSDFEEISRSNDVYQYVKDLALGKANSVINKVKEGLIIGLDTIVYAGNEILEKPASLEEAKEVLRKCSNNFSALLK